MSELVIRVRQAIVGLLVVWLLGAVVALPPAAWAASGPAGSGPAATPLPWEVVAGPSVNGSMLVAAPAPALSDPGPQASAETWTNPLFYIVLCLVVLGSLVIMADFPQNQ